MYLKMPSAHGAVCHHSIVLPPSTTQPEMLTLQCHSSEDSIYSFYVSTLGAPKHPRNNSRQAHDCPRLLISPSSMVSLGKERRIWTFCQPIASLERVNNHVDGLKQNSAFLIYLLKKDACMQVCMHL